MYIYNVNKIKVMYSTKAPTRENFERWKKERATAKEFKVIAKSSNTNSFGLHQFVVVATDGECYKIHGSMYVGKEEGDTVERVGGVFRGFEMPSKQPDCPAPVLKEIFNL